MTIRHIHLHPLGGMAGDMFVAAMLHALPDLAEPVLEAVAKVLPEGNSARLVPFMASGIGAMRFEVDTRRGDVPAHYPDLAARIADAGLSDATRAGALAMLRLLAEAEGAIHGVPVERVHFHEIADWDTLADLTAAGEIVARLDGAGWSLDPLPLGGGRIDTRHGVLPVPAPATARLLEGLAVIDDGVSGERVTPTGAAIARYLALELGSGPRPAGHLGATGYGAGTRTLPGMANVLVAQAIGAETGDKAGVTRERIGIVEFEVDDMTGEEVAVAADRLRAASGVADVVTAPVAAKKGRTATAFRLLVTPGSEDAVADLCFAETSTIGLRLRTDERLVLARTAETAEADGRTLRLKRVARPGGTGTAKVESDDLADVPGLAARRRLAGEAGS